MAKPNKAWEWIVSGEVQSAVANFFLKGQKLYCQAILAAGETCPGLVLSVVNARFFRTSVVPLQITIDLTYFFRGSAGWWVACGEDPHWIWRDISDATCPPLQRKWLSWCYILCSGNWSVRDYIIWSWSVCEYCVCFCPNDVSSIVIVCRLRVDKWGATNNIAGCRRRTASQVAWLCQSSLRGYSIQCCKG